MPARELLTAVIDLFDSNVDDSFMFRLFAFQFSECSIAAFCGGATGHGLSDRTPRGQGPANAVPSGMLALFILG